MIAFPNFFHTSLPYQFLSYGHQGTVVLPFTTVRVVKLTDKDVVQPGEVLTYTIRVTNAGHNNIDANMINISDTLDNHVTYVEDSAIFVHGRFGVVEQVFSIDDSPSGTAFPFDEAGYKIPYLIKRRGGTVDLQFQVIVDAFDSIDGASSVINHGTMVNGEDPDDMVPFSKETPVQYVPAINITNTVYMGSDADGDSCHTAIEYVENYVGTPIVYCWNVTNTGSTHLGSLVLENQALTFITEIDGVQLAPGKSFLFPSLSHINGNITNLVTVTANPVYENGTDIEDLEDVTAEDPSSIGLIQYTPSINVTNTVYLGENDGGATCPTAVEHVEDFKGTSVVYCFNVTNTGDSYLSSLLLEDDALTFSTTRTELLAPGESMLVPYASIIPGNLTNVVTVTANPVDADGNDIDGLSDVSAEDPSSVSEKPLPNIDPRAGEKDCLQSNYNDAGYPGEMDCTSDDTIVLSLSSLPSTCIPGAMVNVTINAEIQVQGSKYDIGWYIATDGGDALTGTCAVSGFHKPTEYAVMSSTTSGGVVSFCDTELENSNQCGDVLLNSNVETATVWVPLLVETAIPCLDDNLDGTLDLSVCLTWRTEETDVACFANGDLSSGLYPSTSESCHCETYEVPTIKVPNVEDVIAPCS